MSDTPRILITGFGPFPGAPYNPTVPLVKRLTQLRRPALDNVELTSHIFHVTYDTVDRELPELIAKVRPQALLMFGLAGCTAVSGTRQVAAANYSRIRAEFAGSRWSDLRAAGASYMDLVIKLRRPQYTDGYETVPNYQQLSAACAKHGGMLNAGI